MLDVPVVRLDPDLPLPAYATPGDAGARPVRAPSATCSLPPGGGRALVPTGVAVAIPEGYAGFVQPRSGLALQARRDVSQHARAHRRGYRGELKVLLVNTDPTEAFEVERGERIAQLVIQAVEHGVEVVDDRRPGESDRGDGGFGHTGR